MHLLLLNIDSSRAGTLKMNHVLHWSRHFPIRRFCLTFVLHPEHPKYNIHNKSGLLTFILEEFQFRWLNIKRIN